MLHMWWSNVSRQKSKAPRTAPSQPVRRMRRWRPALEILEDRTLFSVNLVNVPGWVEQGPGPITNSSGNPVGVGAINMIAVDQSNANRLFVATVDGGVWRTQDALDTQPVWTPLTDQFPSLATRSIAFSPLNNNTLFAGIGLHTTGTAGTTPLVGGLLRTTDGGNSWTLIGQGDLTGKFVERLRPTGHIDSGTGGQVILIDTVNNPDGSADSIWQSKDGGLSWRKVVSGLPDGAFDLVADPGDGSRFFAAVHGQGVYMSTDWGDTWRDISGNIKAAMQASQDVVELAVHDKPSQGTTALYVDIRNGPPRTTPVTVFRSAIPGSGQQGTWLSMGSPFNSDTGENAGFVADPDDSTTVYIDGGQSTGALIRAGHFSVSGTQWENLVGAGASGTSPHVDYRFLAIDSSHTALYNANDGGIWRLQNVHNFPPPFPPRLWINVLGNLRNTELYSIAYDPLNHTLLGGAQDNGSPQQSSPGSLRWTDQTGGDGGVTAVGVFTNGSGQIAFTVHYQDDNAFSGFSRTTFIPGVVPFTQNIALRVNGTGQTLGQVDTPLPFPSPPYVINAVDPRRMTIGTNHALYESLNQGDDLQRLGSFNGVAGLAYGGRLGGTANPDVLWAGLGGNLYIRTSGQGAPAQDVFYSQAGGGGPRSIVLDPDNDRTAFVLDFNNRVWMTTNTGNSWTELTLNLPQLSRDLRTLEYVKNGASSVLLVGGFGGVYRLLNPGLNPTWHLLGAGLPRVVVTDLHYDRFDDVLAVGTYGRGASTVPNARARVTAPSSLQVRGDDGGVTDDTIVLRLDPANPMFIQVRVNGQIQYDGLYSYFDTITIDGGRGHDTINIEDIPSSLSVTTIEGDTGSVNVGKAGRLTGIQGTLTITNPPSFTTVTVDDSTDPTFRTVTLDTFPGDTNFGRISFQGVAPIFYKYADTSSLTVHTGTAGARVDVLATGKPVTLTGHGPNTTVNVGNNVNGVQNIAAALTVNGTSSHATAVNVNDQADPVGRTMTLSVSGPNGTIMGLPGTITYTVAGVNSLTVNGRSSGGNSFNIESTAAGTATIVNTGAGTNAVNLSPTAHNLANLAGLVNINGQGGTNTLNALDQNDTFNDTYTIQSTSLQRSSSALVTFGSIQGTTINGGSGNVTYNIEGSTAPNPVTINGGAGNNTFNLSPTARFLDNIGGNLTLRGAGGTNTLNAFDQAASTGEAYGLSFASVSRPGAGTISYFGIGNVVLNGGSHGNTFAVGSTASATRLTLNTGTGTNNQITVGIPSPTLDFIQGMLTVNGQGATNSLILNDQGTSAARTYTITASAFTRSGSQQVIVNYQNLQNLSLNGGGLGNIINVETTAAGSTATVNGGSGGSTINVGSAGSLQNIQGSVFVTNTNFNTTILNVDDSLDGIGRNVTLSINGGTSTGTITGLTPSGAVITYPQFSLSALTVSGGTGFNTFTVSNTGTGFPTTINSGGLNAVKQVNVQGTTGPLTVNMQGSFRNDVSIGSATNSLDTIQGVATITFSAGSLHSISVNDQGTTAGRTYTLTSTTLDRTGAARISYSNLSANNNFTLNGAGGGNIINVESTGTTTTVNGGSGGSTINLSPTAHNLANLAGLVNIIGTAGTNTLNVNDQATTTQFAQENLYQDHFDRSDPSARTIFNYGGIQSVNVFAGRGDNGQELFGVVSTPAGVPVTVTSAGTSTSAVQFDVGSPLDPIQGPLTIHGGTGGMDLLLLNDANNPNPHTYTVTANTVTRTGMAPIVYDNQTQLILFTSSQALATVNVESTAAGTTTLVVGGGGTDTLHGPDSDTTWQVTGSNAGSFTGGVSFNGMQNLTGGAGANAFVFADGAGVSGNIGGGGTNTLDYTAYASSSVLVDLQTGFATGVGGSVANIQNVIGASGGGDRGLYNLLIGNGGNVLTGGFGRRNLLVAGGSASTLNAGDGEDLLIGGFTNTYDTEAGLASWRQIADYWAGTDDYFTRVGNLTTGTGVPLLDATTVTGNGGGNTMNGNGALALIFSDGLDAIAGFDPNSIIVPIAP